MHPTLTAKKVAILVTSQRRNELRLLVWELRCLKWHVMCNVRSTYLFYTQVQPDLIQRISENPIKFKDTQIINYSESKLSI